VLLAIAWIPGNQLSLSWCAAAAAPFAAGTPLLDYQRSS